MGIITKICKIEELMDWNLICIKRKRDGEIGGGEGRREREREREREGGRDMRTIKKRNIL
jgi:hypothetical protein